jgi:glycosyltransferase involved in cell wall biosynthesis
MLAYAWALLRWRNQLAASCRPDVVIASSPHPFCIYGAKAIAEKTRATLIFEVRDLWPLTLIELGNISPRHPFVMLMQAAEDYAYRVSDRVVSLLPKADRYMVKRGMDPHKFFHIPNGIDAAEWQEVFAGRLPQEHRQTIERFKREGYFLVGYTGAHGLADSLEHLVEAGVGLQNRRVALLLVGQGPEKESLRRLAEANRLTDVCFLPPVPKAAIPEFLAQMDALYIGWKKEPIYQYGISPNKLFDYLMAAKPVIHGIEDEGNLVAVCNAGVTIPPEDPQAIAEAILALQAMDPAERDEMGRRGREYVKAEHDFSHLAEQFLAGIVSPSTCNCHDGLERS